MANGQGAQSSVGVGSETTPGTGVVPTMTVPILSESFSANNPPIPSESIVGDSMLQSAGQGIQEATGGLECEFEGSAVGQLLYYWNPPQGYTSGNWSHGATSAAPTVSASAGGTLATGAYKVKVASIYTSDYDGRNYIMPASAEATATLTSGNQIINVSAWVAPTVPTGYTWLGTAVYRGVAAEATGNEKFVRYVAAPATSTTLDTAQAQDTAVGPFTAVIKMHTWLGTPPASGERLKAFSTTLNKNVSQSERFAYCLANELNLSLPGANEKMKLDLSIIAQKMELVSNPTPSFNPLEPFMSWAGAVFVDGTKDCTIESFQLQMSNNVSKIDALCHAPYSRAVLSANRSGTGTVVRQHEDKSYYTKMLNGTEFALKLWGFGQPITASGASLNSTSHGVDAVPFRYRLELDAFRCKCVGANAPITGPGPIKETINFLPMKHLSEGTELRFRLYNTISAYV